MKHVFKTESLFFLLTLFMINFSYAEDPQLAKIFEKFQKEGTIVLSSLQGGRAYIHNDKRAKKRLSPASTFKIVNSLIALQEGVVRDCDQVIPWDGVKRDFADWNKDQTLYTAFRASCLWAYQWVAQKVGRDVYSGYLAHMNYGNKILGPKLTTFWLEGGGLKISAIEQVEILRNIHRRSYDFSDHVYDALRKIMLVEETKDYALYVKTGAATKNWIGHGWYVGYIEFNDNTWFFATNIRINGFDDLALRKEITLACLQTKIG
tara:strand:- start:2871 stop:3659 length:789 start_codon:yes stop_codon:yes gene_type:complete